MAQAVGGITGSLGTVHLDCYGLPGLSGGLSLTICIYAWTVLSYRLAMTMPRPSFVIFFVPIHPSFVMFLYFRLLGHRVYTTESEPLLNINYQLRLRPYTRRLETRLEHSLEMSRSQTGRSRDIPRPSESYLETPRDFD